MCRKIALLLAFLLLSNNFTYSQTENSVSAGVGFLTAPDFFNLLDNVGMMMISFGTLNSSLDFNSVSPAVYFNYSRNISKSITVGASFVYQKFEKNILLRPQSNPSIEENVGIFTRSYYSFYPEFNFYYLTSDFFTLFSSIGVGISIRDDTQEWRSSNYGTPASLTETKVLYIPCFQINPLGFQIGNKLKITTAFGLGYQGLFTASMKYCF